MPVQLHDRVATVERTEKRDLQLTNIRGFDEIGLTVGLFPFTCYDAKAGKWKEANGKAYFVEAPDIGQLKVSFFGPFYGGYTIIELDRQDYQYSLVSGPNRSYLWLLSRSPVLDQAVVEKLVKLAADNGFPTEELIYVSHESL